VRAPDAFDPPPAGADPFKSFKLFNRVAPFNSIGTRHEPKGKSGKMTQS